MEKDGSFKNIDINLNEKKQVNDETITNVIWGIWDYHQPMKLEGSSLSIKGYSIAALRTNFFIPELGILLDAGLSAPYSNLNHIFITHGHSDHCANIPFHIYGAKLSGTKLQVHVPEESVNYIDQFITYGYCISSHPDSNIPKNELYVNNYYEMQGRKTGDIIDLKIKGFNYFTEVIECYHSIPCVGYGFYEVRKKLKDEYLNLSGKEIGNLKKQNIEINKDVNYYHFVFLGDTSKKIFENKEILKYKTIIIECTFISDDDYDQAEKTFHIHWKDLLPFVLENKENNFILIHFSQRYKRSEIIQFFESEMEKNKIKNIHAWI